MWELLSVFLAGFVVGFVAGAVPFGLLFLRSDEVAERALRLLEATAKRPEEGRREEYWN